jgi:hypothetical protein
MARTKITAYVTPDIADTLKHVAAVADRSLSDIVEDAILKQLSVSGSDAQHAAIMARLDQIGRKIGVLQAGQETHFELTAQATRFAMSIAPDIPEADRATLNARGGERLRNILAIIATKLSDGRSIWRDLLAHPRRDDAPTGPGAVK